MPNVNERPLPLDFVCSFGWFAANLCERTSIANEAVAGSVNASDSGHRERD